MKMTRIPISIDKLLEGAIEHIRDSIRLKTDLEILGVEKIWNRALKKFSSSNKIRLESRIKAFLLREKENGIGYFKELGGNEFYH